MKNKHAQAMQKLSVSKRHAGKSKEEISNMYKELRSKGTKRPVKKLDKITQ